MRRRPRSRRPGSGAGVSAPPDRCERPRPGPGRSRRRRPGGRAASRLDGRLDPFHIRTPQRRRDRRLRGSGALGVARARAMARSSVDRDGRARAPTPSPRCSSPRSNTATCGPLQPARKRSLRRPHEPGPQWNPGCVRQSVAAVLPPSPEEIHAELRRRRADRPYRTSQGTVALRRGLSRVRGLWRLNALGRAVIEIRHCKAQELPVRWGDAFVLSDSRRSRRESGAIRLSRSLLCCSFRSRNLPVARICERAASVGTDVDQPDTPRVAVDRLDDASQDRSQTFHP